MPRSFLIKNKKQHEKHEKTLQPGEGGSEAAVESPEIEETRDGMANPLGRAGCASPAPQSPTPPGEAEGQEDEYLDVESMDTDDESNFKVADKMQVDARPPSSSPRFSPDPAAEDDRRQNGRSRSGTPQSQPEDLSQKPRASPPPMIANQPSPIRGTVPVAREMRRGKCSPESGHVLRVPGKRALGSPHEYMPGPNLGRSPPEQHSLSLKYSDPRFWMAGLPGIPPYLPALPQLFPVTSGASLPGQFHVLPARMDSPPGVSPPGYSAFRLSQDLPYPYPTQHAGRPTYMPFQNRFFPYPRPGQATPSPAPSVLSVPRPVSSHSNRAAEPERQQPQHPERKESKAHSPLNWLLDTPYNLSTKSSAQTPLEKAENPSVIKRQTDPPRYQCEACNKSYATFSGLSKHKQFHCESQIKKEFSCKYCDKTYTSLGALKMHIRTHTLPCKCQICGKAFSRPWLLQGHVRTHTGEKPFTCPHCGRAFADRSNLRAHLQTHSDVKKYSCKTCSKTFSRMSLLLKHEDGSCPGLRTGLSVIPVN